MPSPRAVCPRCGRRPLVSEHKFVEHSVQARTGVRCPMSSQFVPVSGLRPEDFDVRAKIVADLAERVQDTDPADVWEYLTALPSVELQRLMVLALAAIPVDQTVDEMFAWVGELPAAEVGAA